MIMSIDNAAAWHNEIRRAALQQGSAAGERLQEIVRERTKLVNEQLDTLGADIAANGEPRRDTEGGASGGDNPGT